MRLSCCPTAPIQVSQLLRLLATLFPTRLLSLPDGQPRVMPFHKSVLDWLGEPGHAHSTDVRQGHALLGAACARLFTMCPPLVATYPAEDGQAGSSHAYALRHTVAHLCLAHPGGAPQLDTVLLHVGGWERVFAAGGCTTGKYLTLTCVCTPAPQLPATCKLMGGRVGA